MNSRFLPLAVLAVAVVIIATLAWEPLRSRAGLLSPWSSPTPTPATSPSPSTLPRLAVVETETTTNEASPQEPTAELEAPTPEATSRYTTCVDGSAPTVTSADSNQVNYKCASGATGAYLERDRNSAASTGSFRLR